MYSEERIIPISFHWTIFCWFVAVLLIGFISFAFPIYLSERYDLSIEGTVLLAIILLIPGIFSSFKIAGMCFFLWCLQRVVDRRSFVRRCIRSRIVSKGFTHRALRKRNLDLEITKNALEDLPPYQLYKKVKLTQEFIEIENKEYKWESIENYGIYAGRWGRYLTLVFRDKDEEGKNHVVRYAIDRMESFNLRKHDYLIDKYLYNRPDIPGSYEGFGKESSPE